MQHVRATKIGINNQSWGVSTWGSWVENLGIFPWLSQILAGQTETAPTTVAGVIVCFPSWDAWDEDRTVIFFGSVDTNCCKSPSQCPAGLPLLLSCRGSLPPDPEGPDQKFRSETSKQTGRWVRDASRCWRDFGTKTTLQFLPFYIDEKNIGRRISLLNDEALLRQCLFCVHSCFFFTRSMENGPHPPTHTQRTATTIKLMLTFCFSQTSNAGVKN